MARVLTLARVWRIVKEVDLEAIRRQAEAEVRLLVIGETAADADAFSLFLAAGNPDASGWLTSIDAELAARDRRVPGEAVVDGPDLVVLVTRGAEVSPAMHAARQVWLDRKARLLRVALEGPERPGTLTSHGHTARIALDRLGVEGAEALTRGLAAVVEPDRRLALARQFPVLRECTYSLLVDETARANASYAFTTGLAELVPVLGVPLAIGDTVVLTKNQLLMSYRIALAAGKQGHPRHLVGEILGVLGGGLLFRQVARQLIGAIPLLGIIPKVAVAFGGTWAIGRAVTLWATEGQAITAARLKELTREGLSRGRRVANDFKTRRPVA